MRLRQLDGVRAIAILLVIGSHHFLVPFGWTGVDLFFVLSGFLITRILSNTRNDPHYWSKFYIKRAGRILPPLMILFLLNILLVHHIKAFSLLGYAFFLGDYLNVTPYASSLFIVLWSLAIEEHFYIVWPFAVRYLSRKHVAQILVAVLIIEPIARLVCTRLVTGYEPIYYLTFFRLDSIAAGSLLAILVAHPRANAVLARWSMASFLTAVAVWIFFTKEFGATFEKTDNSLLFNGLGYSLITLASFFLVAHLLLKENGWPARFLSIRPLTFIGEISYGMYLFHPIALAALRRLAHVGTGPQSAPGTQKLVLVALPVAIAFSWVSFKWFESPIVRWSKRKTDALDSERLAPATAREPSLILN
jgi:peptidoglycan/LPS O-acetylase OafA/YrhL